MRIRLYQKTEDNLFYFQFLTKEGQLILDSQGYQSKDARNNGVNSVKTNASNTERYETHTEGSNHYFTLKAGNHEEIARSAMFSSNEEMAEAMNTLYVKAGGKGTPPAKTGESKEYAGKKGDDNYRPLAVYEKNTKGVDTGFGTFAEDDGHFFFAFNVDGKTILLSEAYTTSSGRDNGVKSVTKNMVNADRYVRKVHSNGKHYFNLMAGNNQEIATSRWFDSEGEMNEAIAALTRGGGSGEIVGRDGYTAHVDIAAPVVTNEPPAEKKPRKKRKKSDKPKGEKVILKEGNYLFNDVTYHTMRSANGKHYFSFKNPEGKTILLSANVRGYDTEADVDAAVQRVMEFGPYESNYEGKTTKNGKFYFYLNDTEGGRVGKSFFFNTTEDMQAAIGLFIGDVKAATPPPAPAKKEATVDDYLPCGDYAGGEWFYTFFRADREEHYFAYNSPDGKTYLRSEGYTTEKARDNGMESVKKNAPIDARWTTGTALNGKYHYYALKAGNHQEIARSCYYSSEAEMQTAFAWVRGEQSILGEGAKMVDGKWWTAYMFRMKKEEEAARLKAEAEAKRKAEEAARLEAEEKKAIAAKAAAAAAALALKKKEEEELKLAAAKPKDKEDDYLSCKAYQGHPVNDKINNVAFFKHENGQFYFVLYDANGEVKLRSEGFRTSEERDQELSGVVRLHNNPEFYSKIEKAGHYMDVLKDETGREVGRSCLKKVVVEPVAPVDKEDDYLPCKAYQGHPVNDKINNVAFFKHENGQFYFVMYDDNGDVKLRSEGFRTSAERDQELSGVVRLHNNPEFYSKIEKAGHYMDVLKDETGREVGRSCLKKVITAAEIAAKKEEEKKAAAAAAAAAAALALKQKEEAMQKVEEEKRAAHIRKEKEIAAAALAEKKEQEEKSKRAAAVAATAAAAAAVSAKTVVKEEKKGGFPWWLLALLGLLLIGLLWWQGCFGCNTPKVVAPPVPEVTHEEPKVEAPAVVEKSAEELEAEKVAAEAEKARIIEEKAIREREAAEQVTPAVGVEAGFERVNEHK